MAESQLTQKDTLRQERDPVKIVRNNIREAQDILLDCGAVAHVLSQLFQLKRNDNGNYAFYDGIVILHDGLDDKIHKVVEILELAGGQVGLCKTDEEMNKTAVSEAEEATEETPAKVGTNDTEGEASIKEGLIKKLAAMTGVDPEHVTDCREYSVEQQELMIAFVKFLHKGESKVMESIKELLTLVVGEGATESPETAA